MRVAPFILVAAALVAGAARGAAQDTSQAVVKNGVTLPRTVQAGDATLHLNGVALRKKAIFKVYVAGLYLPAVEHDADKILAADTPRRVVMQFVRDVGSEKICGAWNESLEANTPNASDALKQQFTALCGWMEDVKKGDQLVFTYTPVHGTTIEVKGATKGTVVGKEFADALFKSWIGPKPGPGEGFKKDLLGVS